MANLFGAPKTPKVTPPEPAPPPLQLNDDLVAQQAQDFVRRKRGRASTLLSGGMGNKAGIVALKTATGA